MVMRILVDEQPYQPRVSGEQTIRELAHAVCAPAAGPAQRVVVNVRCDGRQIDGDELDAVLQRPLHHFEQLELLTLPLLELARSTLTQTIQTFEEASASRSQIADLLAEGQQAAAMQKLLSFFEAWQRVQQSMLVCAEAMNIDLDGVRVRQLALSDILGLIRGQLTQLKEAIASGDFVVVGDVLRYDMEESMEYWGAFLDHLRGN